MSSQLVDLPAIRRGSRFRQDLGPLSELMESIEAVGLLHPIVLTEDLMLVAGERRLEACRRLGWENIPARVLPISSSELVQAEHDENVLRKDFTPSEKVAITEALRPQLEAEARERQGTRSDLEPSERFSGSHPKVSDQLAETVGWSGPTLNKARQVVAAAETNPDTFEPVRQEMDQTGNVSAAHRKVMSVDEYLDADPKLQESRWQTDLAKAIGKLTALPIFDPVEVGERADEENWRILEDDLAALNRWHKKAEAARPSGLRLVEGGSK